MCSDNVCCVCLVINDLNGPQVLKSVSRQREWGFESLRPHQPSQLPSEAVLNAERTARGFQGDVRFFTEGPRQNGDDFFGGKDTVAAMAGTLADDMLAG